VKLFKKRAIYREYAEVKLLENDAKVDRQSSYYSWKLGCSDFDIFIKTWNILSSFLYLFIN
jgi:hypothetical protein